MSASRERLNELIAAHLAGDLAEEQRRELNGLLRHDPEARAEFASALRRDVLLGEVLREEATDAVTDPESSARPSLAKPSRDPAFGRRAPMRRRSQTSWLPGVAAAALLAGAIGLAVFLSTDPSPRPDRVVQSAPSPAKPDPERAAPPRGTVEEPARELAGERRPVPVDRTRPEGKIETIPSAPKMPVKKPERAGVPVPEPAPAKPPAVRPRVVPPTRTVLAAVDRVEGEAFLVTGETLVAARAGAGIGEGQGFRTIDGAGRATVRFKDGTLLEVGGDTLLKEFSDANGKRVRLERGRLRLDVAKQPMGKPLKVATPHAEVRVLGTTFAVAVTVEATRVGVESGRVQVVGPNGRKIDLKAGRYAVVDAKTTRPRDGWILKFQDGAHPVPAYGGTRDTYIAEDFPSDRYNHQKRVHVDAQLRNGVRKTLSGLLKWDLSGIPKGSRVQAVSLALHVLQPTDDRWGLYPLRSAWSEAEVTWNSPDKDDLWQVPGARGAEDRDAGSVGSVIPRDPGLNEFFLDPEGVAVVQTWIDDPSRNHGFIFAGSETGGWIFTSRESDVKEHRPKVTVYFQPPGRR